MTPSRRYIVAADDETSVAVLTSIREHGLGPAYWKLYRLLSLAPRDPSLGVRAYVSAPDTFTVYLRDEDRHRDPGCILIYRIHEDSGLLSLIRLEEIHIL